MRVCTLTIAAVFLFAVNGFTQKIPELKFYDTMVHVFKLNYDQMKFVLTNGRVTDTSYLYTKKFRMYPKDNFRPDSLPDGHFVASSVFANRITYQYIVHQPFVVTSKTSQNDIVLYLRSKKGNKCIRNVKLELDGKPIPYDAGTGGFTVLKSNLNKELLKANMSFLRISYEGEIYVQKFQFSEGQPQAKKEDYYSSYQSRFVSPGYLILDKPMYKPLDTLNLKSMVLYHKNGRPIRRKALLNINESSQSFTYTQKIKPKSPGAYVFKWAIPDTLKLDRSYTIDLSYRKKGRQFYRKSEFRLEEYELSKNKYDLVLSDENYYAGDDVKFFATAKDMNGFPIQGTKVSYKLRIAEVMNVFKDTFLLTNDKSMVWFEKDTVMEYEPFMECRLPSSIFPPINGRYILDITFTDPVSFEKKGFSKTFLKYTQKEKLVFMQSGDSIIVRTLCNGKDTSRAYFFWTMQNQDTLVKKSIKTPFVYQILPSETQAGLIGSDSIASTLSIQFNPLSILHAKGRRSGDSVFISFAYPFPEPVHYRIYKKDRLVKSGESSTLNFAFQDKTLDEYKIVMTTDLNHKITSNFYEMTFVPEKNRLHFEKSIPSKALPGDSMAVVIKALDFKNKPVAKVNLAAYALNAAFADQIESPYIHIPVQYQNNVEVNPVPEMGTVTCRTEAANGEFALRGHHFSRFDLYRNEMYSLIFPKKGVYSSKWSKQALMPEFSVVVVMGENIYAPRYILLDGKPVYISDISKYRPYSFAASSGAHTIKFRVMDKTFEWNQMKLDANSKHVFSFNMDSLKVIDSQIKITDSLPMFEPNPSEKELLYSSMWITSVFNADSMEVVSQDLNYKRKHNGLYNIARLNIDGDLYMVHGPFEPRQNYTVQVNSKASFFNTGTQIVYHWDDVLQEFQKRPLGEIKGAFMSFSELSLNHLDLLTLLVPDTLVPKPEVLNVVSKRKPELGKSVEVEESFYQNTRSKNPGNDVQIIVDNTSDSAHVKSIWLISKKDFGASDYISYVNKSMSTFGLRESNDSIDVYLFMNKNRMKLLRNVKLQRGDRLYINPNLLDKEPFSKDKIVEPLKIYAELNAVPLLPFYYGPHEASSQIKRVKSGRNNLIFHGMITSESQQPLSDALVYLEVNGKYRFGAVTNQNGLFEFLDLPSATYQVKIYHPGYKISHFSPMLFEANSEYELNTSLLESHSYVPAFEVVHNDFRFMAYAKSTSYNMLKLSIHEKESRSRLQQVRAVLKCNGDVVKSILINDTDFEMPFPYDLDNKLYTLEFSKPGYTSLVLNTLEFVDGYTYIVETFMGLTSKEILVKKEYDIAMEAKLPQVNDDIQDSENIKVGLDSPSFNGSSIIGRVTDENGKPLDFATVRVTYRNEVFGGAKTDENGNYKIKPVKPGVYELTASYAGYNTEALTGLRINKNRQVEINFKLVMKTGTTKKDIVIKTYKRKLIDPQNPVTKAMTKEEIRKAATISTGDFASMDGGMYQRRAGDASVNAGGDRMSSATYMIDGMSTTTLNYSSTKGVIDKLEKEKSGSIYADAGMLDQVVNTKNTSLIRSKFNDVGYWKPNLLTNKKGEVAFTVKLPDNITSWKSYVVGVGQKWLHGIDSAETKVYKPLQTICLVPNYLYQDDSLLAKLKFQNLTASPLDIQTRIEVNGKTFSSSKVNVKSIMLDSAWLQAGKLDTLRFEGGLTYQEKYKDAEHYDIPVLSPAMITYSSQHFLMNKDSVYTLKVDEKAQGEIMFSNSLYEKIVAVANELGKYEYNCVEQTSSKLAALLLKEQIQLQLKQKSTCTKEIHALMGRLADLQKVDGSFSWWRNGAANDRMTAYVMEVTSLALRRGYQNNVYNAASNYLKQQFRYLSVSDQIYAAYVLQSNGLLNMDHKSWYNAINKDFLNSTDRLYLLKTKMMMNEEVSKEELYKVVLELNANSRKHYSDNFFYDTKSNLFLAYTLFRNTTMGKDLVDLFKRRLLAGEYEQHLNTYSQAKLIEALLMEASTDTAKPILSQLVINDSMKVKDFPFHMPLRHNAYRIKHTGGDVYVQTSERHLDPNPSMHDSVLSIKTSFVQHGNTVFHVKAGEECILNVHLHAYRKGEHVMVEIPLPAGFKVAKKEANFGSGDYVEYYKNKVVYFFSKMDMGTKTLQIRLLPLFKGNYTMPPAKISLMYYPFIFGNTTQQKVSIQ